MVFSAQDVEDKLHLFNQLFINTLNNHAPVKHTKESKIDLSLSLTKI